MTLIALAQHMHVGLVNLNPTVPVADTSNRMSAGSRARPFLARRGVDFLEGVQVVHWQVHADLCV